MYLAEFDEKKWEAIIREEEREQGIEQGIELGREEGREIGRKEVVLSLLEDHTPEETAILVKMPITYILQVAAGESE